MKSQSVARSNARLSIALILSLAAQTVAPHLGTASVASLAPFHLPPAAATFGETHQGASDQTLYLIQDAHLNESAQLNLSNALETILGAEKLRYVFLEGGTGDVSLGFLSDTAPREKRKEIGLAFLRRGLLQGSEYLSLISNRDFVLWGVENQTLYRKALQSYRQIVGSRDAADASLQKLKNTCRYLKSRIYNPSLLAFDRTYEAYLTEKISLGEYLERLSLKADEQKVPMLAFPQLVSVRELVQKEKGLMLSHAAEQQMRAIRALEPADQNELTAYHEQRTMLPFKFSARARPEETEFYAKLEQKLGTIQYSVLRPAEIFPELYKFFDYLHAVRKIDTQRMLEEQEMLAGQIYEVLARTPDEIKLAAISEQLRVYERIVGQTASSADLERYTAKLADLAPVRMQGFMNRKLMEWGRGYEQALFAESALTRMLELAAEFQRLTQARDEAFVKNALTKMKGERQQKAVLIAGGYHLPFLQELLKKRGISYVTVVPQVPYVTNQRRYERMLLQQVVKESQFRAGCSQ